MKARMEELSVFYDENVDDEKIHFFEKLRLKLKKTLQLKPNMLNNANPKFRQSIINGGQEFMNTKNMKNGLNVDLSQNHEMSEEDGTSDDDIQRQQRQPFSPMENQQPEVVF